MDTVPVGKRRKLTYHIEQLNVNIPVLAPVFYIK